MGDGDVGADGQNRDPSEAVELANASLPSLSTEAVVAGIRRLYPCPGLEGIGRVARTAATTDR
jgi:hypothetical protein